MNKFQLVANNVVGSTEVKDNTFTFNNIDQPWGTGTLLNQRVYPMMVPFGTGPNISVTGSLGSGNSPNAIPGHDTLWYSNVSTKSVLVVSCKFRIYKQKSTNSMTSWGYGKLSYQLASAPGSDMNTDMFPHNVAYMGGSSAGEDFACEGVATVNGFINTDGWNNYGFTVRGFVQGSTYVKIEQFNYLISEYQR